MILVQPERQSRGDHGAAVKSYSRNQTKQAPLWGLFCLAVVRVGFWPRAAKRLNGKLAASRLTFLLGVADEDLKTYRNAEFF